MTRPEENRPPVGQTGRAATKEHQKLPAIVADALGETVTLSRSEYDSLADDAACWRMLNSSPHVADLLAEWAEWVRRAELSESTAAMAAVVDWRKVANSPTYAELRRRRHTYDRPALTPAQIRQRAQASLAAFERRHGLNKGAAE